MTDLMTPAERDFIRWALTLSDEDYAAERAASGYRQSDFWNFVDHTRLMLSMTDDRYAEFCEQVGYDHDVNNWRQYIILEREQATTSANRRPEQPSLFDTSHGEGVYFHSDGTAIKIGRTAVAERNRRRSHQTGNPRDIVLLAWIPRASEKALHVHFDHLRIPGRREWFRTDPELMTFIQAWRLIEVAF
jgi:hypothetical protein